MRLRGGGGAAGGGGGGEEGLSLAICMMRSMQQGNGGGGGLMGNHCVGLMGKVKLLPRKREEKKKIWSAAPNISTETNCSGVWPMRARFPERSDQWEAEWVCKAGLRTWHHQKLPTWAAQ